MRVVNCIFKHKVHIRQEFSCSTRGIDDCFKVDFYMYLIVTLLVVNLIHTKELKS